MNINLELAAWSNTLIVSAMAIYAIAFIFSAFDLFGRGERAATVAARREERRAGAPTPVRTKRHAMAGAGASATATADADVDESVTDESDVDVADTDDSPTADESAGAKAKGTGRSTKKSASDASDDSAPRPLRRAARIGTSLIALAGLLHLAAVITRGVAVDRVPWGNMMEYAMSATSAVVIVYIVVQFYRDLRFLGTLIAGGTLITLGLAITVLYTPAAPVVPALDNYWIAIHVPIAIFATALLYISAVLAIFQLIKQHTEAKGAKGLLRFTEKLPSSGALEEWSYRIAAVGFVMWTFTVIAGAIWAELAWGRYWGWDPKEVWTFVVWVVYAAYLHARATRGWSKTRIAILNLVGLFSVIFNFSIVNVFINGLHSYSGLD